MRAQEMFLEDAAQAVTGIDQACLAIMTMKGDSMAGILDPGDRFVVNLADQRPSQPGLFLIDDGVGLAPRHVEYLPHTSPPMVRLSHANEAYSTTDVPLERLKVVGRIVGTWRRV